MWTEHVNMAPSSLFHRSIHVTRWPLGDVIDLMVFRIIGKYFRCEITLFFSCRFQHKDAKHECHTRTRKMTQALAILSDAYVVCGYGKPKKKKTGKKLSIFLSIFINDLLLTFPKTMSFRMLARGYVCGFSISQGSRVLQFVPFERML